MMEYYKERKAKINFNMSLCSSSSSFVGSSGGFTNIYWYKILTSQLRLCDIADFSNNLACDMEKHWYYYVCARTTTGIMS